MLRTKGVINGRKMEISQVLKGRVFVDNRQIANLKAELKLPPKISVYSMIVF
jgi:hypothetical protein